MRLLSLSLFFTLICLSTNHSSAEVELLTSPDGHEIHFLSMPDAENVAIQIAWPTVWSMTPGRNPTVPNITTQLMFSGGAGELNASQVLERFNDLQAASSLIPTADNVRGTLVVHKDKLDEALVIANLVIAQPSFDNAWLTRTKESNYGRINQASKTPTNRAWEAVRRAVIRNRPLRDSLSLQNAHRVLEVVRDEVVEFHRETFVRSGITITVAGPISAERTVDAVDQLLAGLPEGQPQSLASVEYDFSPRIVLLHDASLDRSFLGFMGPLPPTSKGGEFADVMAFILLGQGEKSELFAAVRTQLRTSYGFNAGYANYTRNSRILVLSGEVETEKLVETHRVVLETYHRFQNNGPIANIEGLRNAMLSGVKRNTTDPARVSIMMLESVLDGFSANRVTNITQEIESITAESLKARLSQLYPPADELITIIVSNDANAFPGACVIEAPEDIDQCP